MTREHSWPCQAATALEALALASRPLTDSLVVLRAVLRVAWGAVCWLDGRSERVVVGGALPAESSVQDAEMAGD